MKTMSRSVLKVLGWCLLVGGSGLLLYNAYLQEKFDQSQTEMTCERVDEQFMVCNMKLPEPGV